MGNEKPQLPHEEERLWGRVYECLIQGKHQKKGDATPLHALNRLIWDHLPGVGWCSRDNCKIRRELRSTGDLHSFVLRHKRSTPRCQDGPVIVFFNQGTMYVIDGNNRINNWKEQRGSAPPEVEVIIIECK